MPADRLAQALRIRTQRAQQELSLLRSWVEQSSYTADRDDVDAMGELLAHAFALPGLELQRQPSQKFGTHLVWRTPAWESAADRRLLLVGHHDTVFPKGSFAGWVVEGERVRGPGVLDMKGGIATVHAACSALAEVGELAAVPLAFVCVADEEVGSPESRAFTRELARSAQAALVFEAGRPTDAIITERKGTGSVEVVATGRAAHAGNAHREGINAIWALARFIEAAQRLTDYERGVTLNVGLVQGGTSKNTVPERATCTLDFRMVHLADGDWLMLELARAAGRIQDELGAKLELDGGVRRPALEASEGSRRLAERYAECARAEGLGCEMSPLLGGGSDANDVGAVGVPVIDGLGPRGRGFHTHDEYIEIPTLAQRSGALIRFLHSWVPG